MAKKRKRLRIGKKSITLDFDYNGERCLERLDIDPSDPVNVARANDKLHTIRAEISAGTFLYAKHFPHSRRVIHTERTISVALWDYFEYWKVNKQPKQSTIKEKKYEIERLKRDFGDLFLSDLTEDHILGWIKDRENEGRSGRTINNLLTSLRQTLNRALRRRDIVIFPRISGHQVKNDNLNSRRCSNGKETK